MERWVCQDTILVIKSPLGIFQSIFLSISSESGLASNKIWDHKVANPNMASASILLGDFEDSGVFNLPSLLPFLRERLIHRRLFT